MNANKKIKLAQVRNERAILARISKSGRFSTHFKHEASTFTALNRLLARSAIKWSKPSHAYVRA